MTNIEIQRTEQFEQKARSYEASGYKQRDLTISNFRVNVMAFVLMIPVIVIMGIVYYTVNHTTFLIHLSMKGFLIFFVVYFVLLALHELIHGITWAVFTEHHFHDIKFGFMWKTMMPYCTCQAALNKSQYILGAAMPTIILGFLPLVLAIILSSPLIFTMSALMVLSGGGDMCIIQTILSQKGKMKDSIYMDHPSKCGVVVFEKHLN